MNFETPLRFFWPLRPHFASENWENNALKPPFTRVFSAAGLIIIIGIATGSAAAQSCVPRDFLQEPLPTNPVLPLWKEAISLAYPNLTIQHGQEILIVHRGQTIVAESPTARPANVMIAAPTVGDQFSIPYPLSRNLDLRLAPFHDPGRARNARFLDLLYGASPGEVEPDLQMVNAGSVRFRVTRRHSVSCQLSSALADLNLGDDAIAPLFSEVGGGYNWRRITGTDRLSPHSYGIAFDVNASLGGYWRWTGATEGAVGAYQNNIPWQMVEALERRGFIWGGKWHHFDGMHFEYRPDLILYSRLIEGDGK